jgi:hypothetical protein
MFEDPMDLPVVIQNLQGSARVACIIVAALFGLSWLSVIIPYFRKFQSNEELAVKLNLKINEYMAEYRNMYLRRLSLSVILLFCGTAFFFDFIIDYTNIFPDFIGIILLAAAYGVIRKLEPAAFRSLTQPFFIIGAGISVAAFMLLPNMMAEFVDIDEMYYISFAVNLLSVFVMYLLFLRMLRVLDRIGYESHDYGVNVLNEYLPPYKSPVVPGTVVLTVFFALKAVRFFLPVDRHAPGILDYAMYHWIHYAAMLVCTVIMVKFLLNFKTTVRMCRKYFDEFEEEEKKYSE